MRYRELGGGELRVSELCLGISAHSKTSGQEPTRAETHTIFDTFVAAGGNFIAMPIEADGSTAEHFISDRVSACRERFVIASSCILPPGTEQLCAPGRLRRYLTQTLDARLARLRTPYLDLFWIHGWDYFTPVEEVLQTLGVMVRVGKVLCVGLADAPAWIVTLTHMLAEWRGWPRFAAVRAPYSLAARDAERELLPVACASEMTVLAESPLAGGVLAGEGPEASSRTNGGPALSDTLAALARETGCSPAQIALSWVRQRQERANIIPIVTPPTVAHMRDALASLDITLTPHRLQRLDDASAPPSLHLAAVPSTRTAPAVLAPTLRR